MSKNNTTILKVLVGSRAHGLHNEDSDYDYRSVYVNPTKEILSLGHKYKGSEWLEGDKQDNTAWEIGHFLHLATKCNPTILEVFKAPKIEQLYNNENIVTYKEWQEKPDKYDSTLFLGYELSDLFPYVWNPIDCFNAFTEYGLNQRKKMLDNKDNRWEKYAVAYLRTLSNLCDLLIWKDFSLEIKDDIFKENLIKIKNKEWSVGKVVDSAEQWTILAKNALKECKHEPDKDKVNEFLLKIRKKFWE